MFSRVLTTAAKTSGTLLVGAVIDRAAYKSIPAPATNPSSESNSWFKTGNQRLADKIGSPPQSDASILSEPFEKHKKFFKKSEAICRDAPNAADNVKKTYGNIKDEFNTIRGAKAIVDGKAKFTADDVSSIVRTAAIEKATGLWGVPKAFISGAYAVATTTPEGVAQASETITQRLNHETKQAVVNAAITSSVLAAVGMIPHPVTKVAAVGLNAINKLSTGAQLSESMRRAGSSSDDSNATTRKIAEILRSKVDS